MKKVKTTDDLLNVLMRSLSVVSSVNDLPADVLFKVNVHLNDAFTILTRHIFKMQ